MGWDRAAGPLRFLFLGVVEKVKAIMTKIGQPETLRWKFPSVFLQCRVADRTP